MKIFLAGLVSGTIFFCVSVTLAGIWEIPACAWSRPLGDHPPGAAGAVKTKRGIPVGGIGSGNFMFNLCGSFGPWEFDGGVHKDIFLSPAGFLLREKSDGKCVTRALATEDCMEAWPKLEPGQGRYYALYPKAWFVYAGFKADVSLKQFSPIIKENYRETSFPVGIFQFMLFNPTSQPIEEAIAFSFPAVNREVTLDAAENQLQQDLENNIGAVVLKTANGGEWCLAVKSTEGTIFSWLTSWDAEADGNDIYQNFSNDGVLKNGALDNSFSAGAIAVKCTLAPGTTVEIPFVLAWDFPITRFTQASWYRRYTEYFNKEGENSFEIARQALLNYPEWEVKIDTWIEPIINEPAYPDWLKQGALNELYYDTFGGVFWENGCINQPEEFWGLHPDDHKYSCMECQDYAYTETFDVRHYECRHYLVLWPEIEKTVLKCFADFITDPENKDGRAAHDAGWAKINPYLTYGYGTTPLPWKDLPSKFIQQCYAYYYKTEDIDFLNYVWPACKRCYEFMKSTDLDEDYLPNNHGSDNTYDSFGLEGTSSLCGGLWIGALAAMEKFAEIKEATGLLEEIKIWSAGAKENFVSQLWDDPVGYFHIDVGSQYPDALQADGLNGQRYCETTGLEDIVPLEKLRSHYQQVYQRCVQPLKDYDGDESGDLGAINAIRKDGSPLKKGQQSDEVWTGTSYFLAAAMYNCGKRANDKKLMEAALKTAYGVYYQTWLNEESAYWFDTPEAWSAWDVKHYRALQYQRPRAIWELLLEIKNPY